jgi:hypothetical protein
MSPNQALPRTRWPAPLNSGVRQPVTQLTMPSLEELEKIEARSRRNIQIFWSVVPVVCLMVPIIIFQVIPLVRKATKDVSPAQEQQLQQLQKTTSGFSAMMNGRISLMAHDLKSAETHCKDAIFNLSRLNPQPIQLEQSEIELAVTLFQNNPNDEKISALIQKAKPRVIKSIPRKKFENTLINSPWKQFRTIRNQLEIY